jgi:hypothetical protein
LYSKDKGVLRNLKFLILRVPPIQIPTQNGEIEVLFNKFHRDPRKKLRTQNLEISFHTQIEDCVESIHAPNLRIRFYFLSFTTFYHCNFLCFGSSVFPYICLLDFLFLCHFLFAFSLSSIKSFWFPVSLFQSVFLSFYWTFSFLVCLSYCISVPFSFAFSLSGQSLYLNLSLILPDFQFFVFLTVYFYCILISVQYF